MEKVSLYERVAGDISLMIRQGTFRPGERIPSVRELSRNRKISITTVMEAYRLLEDQGIIEGRPQSGYYVLSSSSSRLAEPSMSNPSKRPTKVSINELVMMVMSDARRPDLVQLGAAIPNPDLLPVEKINRTMSSILRRHPVQSISYACAPGIKALQVQITRRALTAGCTLNPDDVIITAGCQEAVMLALRSICRPGDTVAIESPTYYMFLQAIESLGLKALEIPTHPRDGVCLSTLRYAIEHNAIKACLFMPNFHNPLGSCMPDERKEELVEMLAERDIPLIEDDIYGDLSFSYQRPKVAKAYDGKGNVVLCSSFSKTIAPGYRIGYIAPGKFRDEIHRQKYISTFATATPQQLAIAEFLTNGGYDYLLRNTRRAYAKSCSLMADAIGRYFPEGTKATRPSGGYVLWVELPKYIDSLELYEKAIKVGIAFAPGPIFSSQPKYKHFIRLNAANWSEDVDKALAKLGKIVRGMK